MEMATGWKEWNRKSVGGSGVMEMDERESVRVESNRVPVMHQRLGCSLGGALGTSRTPFDQVSTSYHTVGNSRSSIFTYLHVFHLTSKSVLA